MHLRLGALVGAALFACACNPARGVPILLWHAVGEGSADDGYDVPAEEFERELALIESSGARTVSLDQVFDARNGGAPLPARAVVLTFDDGRAGLLSSALPLLEKHGMSAELFVVPAWTGDDEAHRHVEQDAQGKHSYLLWPELAQMVKGGVFHVQSHGMAHRPYNALSAEEMRRELVDSRLAITAHLGVPVNFYAYPFGGFDWTYQSEAEAAGYRAAVAVGSGLGTRFGLRRYSLHRGQEEALRAILADAFGAAAPR